MTRIIVTRPQSQAATWVDALRWLGYDARSVPLIDIYPAESTTDRLALQMAWEQLDAMSALMFVSRVAVDAFFKLNWHLVGLNSAQSAIENIAMMYPRLRCWSTGPGTTASLQAAQWPAHRIDGPRAQAVQYDSESLWEQVQAQVNAQTRVLILRGRDAHTGRADGGGRDWLAQQIQARGAQAQMLVVYERRVPEWDSMQRGQIQSHLSDGSIWLLSSSQAVRNLDPDWDVSDARCVCTHERIAKTARDRGFAVVSTSRPELANIVASIKSLDE